MRRANGTGTVVKLSGDRRYPYMPKYPYLDKFEQIKQVPLGYFAKASAAQAFLDQFNAIIKHGGGSINDIIPAPDSPSEAAQKMFGSRSDPGTEPRAAASAPAPAPSPSVPSTAVPVPNVAAPSAPATSDTAMTVQQVYDSWSSRAYKKYEAGGSVSCISSYKAAWNKRVSRFAESPICEIKLDHWQSLLDEDEDEGLSQSSINNDATLIHFLCTHAIKYDLMDKDYSQYLEVPKVGPKVIREPLTDLQLDQLSRLIEDGFPWADTALMLCYLGFRISAFLALTPSSYNEKGQYLRGGIKTPAGKGRIVPVHPKIMPYLQSWLKKGGSTIICNEDGQPITAEKYRDDYFHPVMEAIGLPKATPHCCRHTFSTRLYKAGARELEIKRLMGHSNGNVTEGYTHTDIEQLTAAILKMN